MVDNFTGEKNLSVKLSTIFITSEIVNHSHHKGNCQPFSSQVKLLIISLVITMVDIFTGEKNDNFTGDKND
jgi:hypothetical protein